MKVYKKLLFFLIIYAHVKLKLAVTYYNLPDFLHPPLIVNDQSLSYASPYHSRYDENNDNDGCMDADEMRECLAELGFKLR